MPRYRIVITYFYNDTGISFGRKGKDAVKKYSLMSRLHNICIMLWIAVDLFAPRRA